MRARQVLGKGKAVKALTALALVGILLSAGCLGSGGSKQVGKYTVLQASSGQLSIPSSEIGTTAEFYAYDYGGVLVKFFAVKGSDGKIHTAFDACDVCYPEKKGYRQEGSNMVCNNCGMTFAINNIGKSNTGGGCWPSYLAHSTSGDVITIGESDAQNGLRYFQ